MKKQPFYLPLFALYSLPQINLYTNIVNRPENAKIGFDVIRHFRCTILIVLIECYLSFYNTKSGAFLIFEDFGLPNRLHLQEMTSFSYILYKYKDSDFKRDRQLKYEKTISSNCKFLSPGICTSKCKPDRSC